jgi:hypothetical protein
MDAKKCDRCGSFYVRKELKTDNAVVIFGKKVSNVILEDSRDGLKIFMKVQHITPYIAKVEDTEE